MSNKNILLIVAVLVVVAAGVVALMVYGPRRNEPSQTVPAAKHVEKPVKIDRTEVSSGKLPQRLPADLPFEDGAKVLDNYSQTTDSGMYQATRAYESTKSMDENYKIYMDYIQKNGWKLLNSVNQPAVKVLSAKKDNANLQVTISDRPSTKTRVVEVSYTQQ